MQLANSGSWYRQRNRGLHREASEISCSAGSSPSPDLLINSIGSLGERKDGLRKTEVGERQQQVTGTDLWSQWFLMIQTCMCILSLQSHPNSSQCFSLDDHLKWLNKYKFLHIENILNIINKIIWNILLRFPGKEFTIITNNPPKQDTTFLLNIGLNVNKNIIQSLSQHCSLKKCLTLEWVLLLVPMIRLKLVLHV